VRLALFVTMLAATIVLAVLVVRLLTEVFPDWFDG
jgi:hypothetical protein